MMPTILYQALTKVRRCAICGARLEEQEDGSWKCPNCAYVEPE